VTVSPAIALCTLNAKYAHCALSLRYLRANLGDLRDRACLIEALASERPVDIAERILATAAPIVGLGIYVWNTAPSLELVLILKAVRPELIVVLGGPEVSHETDEQAIVAAADYVITGEGEDAFSTLCAQLVAGERPADRVIAGGLPDLTALVLPYDQYTDQDLASRYVYVEASRGCPYRCEFCLSALDTGVRPFPADALLAELETLIQRGARHFRFIDRTFNLDTASSTALLQFFLDRQHLGLFVHFEAVPDRFPDAIREAVARFKPGVLQLEIGIQTLDKDTARRISRPQNETRIADNLRFLRDETNAHIHADLIVGLPGEDEASFARGFDRLVALGPTEIQVGILKRLRGTPIIRHTARFAQVYSTEAPYEVLQTSAISFGDMQRMKRFARAWDLVANRGNFPQTLNLVLADAPYARFNQLTEWMFEELGSFYAVDLVRLAKLLFVWLTEHGGITEAAARDTVAEDYCDDGRRKTPRFLKGAPERKKRAPGPLHRRQLRHAEKAERRTTP
jgi:hypothetical protein